MVKFKIWFFERELSSENRQVPPTLLEKCFNGLYFFISGGCADIAVVSLWDFAGQFVYYATHQLFFSPRSVYLLVLNLAEDLEKTKDKWYMDFKGITSIETQGNMCCNSNHSVPEQCPTLLCSIFVNC